MEENIKQWLADEFKNQLDHHEVLRADKFHPLSDMQIESYLDRNEYVTKDNIDELIEKYIENSNVCTEDNFDDSVREWMGNNFDISDYEIDDKLKDAIRALDFTVEVS